jgi:hypothetical protein
MGVCALLACDAVKKVSAEGKSDRTIRSAYGVVVKDDGSRYSAVVRAGRSRA